MIVRKIHPQELDITVNLCNYYAQEAAIPDDDYDVNSVAETVRLYSTHNEYIWLNLYEGQRPVGLIAGCITNAPWNRKKLHGHIDLVFLLESHRSLDNFKQLINKFEEWAKEMQATTITAGDIGINVERTKKVYNHLGFKEGLWMSKELDNVWSS